MLEVIGVSKCSQDNESCCKCRQKTPEEHDRSHFVQFSEVTESAKCLETAIALPQYGNCQKRVQNPTADPRRGRQETPPVLGSDEASKSLPMETGLKGRYTNKRETCHKGAQSKDSAKGKPGTKLKPKELKPKGKKWVVASNCWSPYITALHDLCCQLGE